MLWAATELEGTFDEIKVNVYAIIEQLVAAGLSQPHLDHLFAKFSANRGRSLADTLRLLDLLRNLAKHDVEVSYDSLEPMTIVRGLNCTPHRCSLQAEELMAERLMEMSWALTMDADAPREVHESGVLADVIGLYNHKPDFEVYLSRCIAQLRSKQHVMATLHVLQAVVQRAGDGFRGDLVDALQTEVLPDSFPTHYCLRHAHPAFALIPTLLPFHAAWPGRATGRQPV